MSTSSLCLAARLVLVGPARAADEKWQTFTSKEGRFSVALPGKPTEETKQVPTPGGKKKALHVFVLASAADQIYHLNYSDYSKEAIQEDKNKETAFDAIRDGNVKAFKGKLVSDKKIAVGTGKKAGRELLIELPTKKDFYRALSSSSATVSFRSWRWVPRSSSAARRRISSSTRSRPRSDGDRRRRITP